MDIRGSQSRCRVPFPPPPPRDPRESLVVYERGALHTGERPHSHVDLEMTLITQGAGLREVGDRTERFEPGDVCLVGELLPHMWRTTEEKSHSIVIHFDRTSLATAIDRPEFSRLSALLDLMVRGLVVDGAARKWAEAQIVAMNDLPVGHWDRLTRLLSVLGRLAASGDFHPMAAAGPDSRGTSTGHERLLRIMANLEGALTGGETQAQVAASVGMSPSTFSRFFRRHMGRTFERHLHEIRVGRAAREIRATGDSITDIAFRTGFESLSHFNRTFRALQGLTPTSYRKLHRCAEDQHRSPAGSVGP